MKLAMALAWLALAGAAMAQAPQPPAQAAAAAPRGEPQASSALRDREFGVRTDAVGLQRRVEMYQWRRSGTGYAAAWAQAPVDSTGFDAAHANPGAFPVRTRYWIATRVTLDGHPVDEDVLKDHGRWRAFRPGFSALPGNLAATFQPEGDGLSSSENPLDPQVGDLRITWHALTLPPLEGKVALEAGIWVSAQASAVAAGDAQTAAAPAIAEQPAVGLDKRWVWGAAALAALLLVVALVRRRGKPHR